MTHTEVFLASIEKYNRIFSEHKCNDNYYDDSMCPGGVYSLDQDFLRPLAFQYWGSGQPDNTANMENYAVIDIERRYYGFLGYHDSYGAWNDVAGTSLQHTICEYNIPSVEGSGS